MYKIQNICLLGATGSIGQSSLDLIAENSEQFHLFACSAWRNVDKALQIILQFKPKYMVVADELAAKELKNKLKNINKNIDVEILHGEKSLELIASLPEVDTLIAAIVGSAGLASTFAAAALGKRILLANKEVLVAAGDLFFKNLHPKTLVLPLDSEHNAIFQCLQTSASNTDYNINSDINLNKNINITKIDQTQVKKIILTASGGPFLNTDLNTFEEITPRMACKHPKWSMGQKISVDSATMMNKGLEVIEAHYLFQMPLAKIEVLIHPQSIIHSMVEYMDGSVIAQMSNPDMRVPIIHALAYPKRLPYQAQSINWLQQNLSFQDVDYQRYPCLNLAFQALKASKTNVLNAANEVAVAAFLNQEIKFTQISEVIEDVLACDLGLDNNQVNSLDEVLEVDQKARAAASMMIKRLS